MKKNKIALQVAAFSLITIAFIGCDKDFATLDSDVINEDNATNFDIQSQQYDIITYSKALDAVQTNGLPVNSLGVYNDFYGRTTSSFVSQLSLSTFEPSFGEEVEIDSVVLTIPYFSRVTNVDENGDITYELDSVIGNSPINLKIFESNYFIRDFDPNGDFDDSQAYFSNKYVSESEEITDAALESQELSFVPNPTNENHVSLNADNNVTISDEGYVLTEPDNDDEDTEPQILQRQSPSLRLKLDTEFWKTKIIDREGDAVLSSQNNFSEYFRGLYFKAEPVSDNGSFLILNTGVQNANITIYYTSLTASTTDEADATTQNNLVLNFRPNRINFFENNFTLPTDSPDEDNGDERLFLKGGAGSLAQIKLFNGDDIDQDDDFTFDTWKEFFVETDEEGKFVRSKRLINEANLVFYVDQDFLDLLMHDPKKEPNRLYLYDTENKTPLVDYFLDVKNNTIPSFSIPNHLGPLQRVGNEFDGEGIKYKLKITEHIKNLLLRDSTNVELGLATSLNVNLEEQFLQRETQNDDDQDLTTPISSVLSPRGTVLHGNNTNDESKKVYLEVFYTEPNN